MSSAQDVYAANLQQSRGYPLHSPEPRSHLGVPYDEGGFQIGDVGYVNSEGEFNPLFNIGLPPPETEDPHPLYEPVKFSEPYSKPAALPEGHVFMSGVQRNVDVSSPRVYQFIAKSDAGAILILPSGATLFDLQKWDLEVFRNVATQYAPQWCKIRKDESLYLVTGLYKTRDFTLAAFDSGCSDGKIYVEQQGAGTYKWDCAFETYFRVGPQNTNYENQTVLIKGFRMTVRWSWLAVIERVTQYESPTMRRIASFFATLSALLGALFAMTYMWLSRTIVEHSPRLSQQPLHPSDIINRYLLDKDPGALVAITHDNEWIDMLEKKRLSPEDLMREDRLRDFLEKEYTWYSERDVVYLRSQIKNTDDEHHESESSQPMSAMQDVRIVITHIRAENVTTGIGRVPVGFYVQVDIPGSPSRRTKNKSVPIYDRVIQWDDLIYLPPDPSIIVKLTLFASFEFDPMLSKGELLHILEKSVGELLHQTHPFTLSDGQGEDVLPWASLLVSVQEWHCDGRMPGSSKLDVTVDQEEFSELTQVTEATERGHDALLRYHKDRNEDDLKYSVTQFERALANCPDETPRRAVALFNLATAEFFIYRSHGTSPNFDASISLYRKALELRRGDHQDRPMTLLHLAQAILYHYRTVGCEAATDDELCNLVGELRNICPEGTHTCRAADLVFQTYERLRLRDSNDLSKVNELISKLDMAAQELPEAYFDRPIRFNNLGLALQRRFQLRRDANDLDLAIEWLEKAVQITPNSHPEKPNYLNDLGDALLVRFQRQRAFPSTRRQ